MENEEYAGISSTPYASPMYNHAGSIMVLTNPENELYKLELTLRSKIVDSEGKIHICGEPLMNDEGISSVLGLIQSIVNQITIMSNLDSKREINMLIMYLADTMIKDLMFNNVSYEIKNPATRSKILFTAVSTAYICMKRATEEGERRFWKGSQQDIRTTVVNDSKKKGGFLSSINLWK